MREFTTHATNTPSSLEHQYQAFVTMTGHFRLHHHRLKPRTLLESNIVYCVAGSGRITVGERAYAIHTGDAYLLPAHCCHTAECHPREGWDIYWCHYQGSYAEMLMELAGFSPLHPVRTVGQSSEFVMRYETIMTLLRDRPPHFGLSATRELIALLITLRQAHGELGDTVLDYLHVNGWSIASLDEVVALSGKSKTNFIRLFKQATGTTPWLYILHLKIDKAKELLLNSQLTVKEIAHTVRIPDPLYFSRLFKKLTGVPPLTFRKTHER
jgi:AraC-like DNA-binding protein